MPMPTPNASPQGIAGLMQKPPGQVPGQQPMPSPNKASPMAGLGSVDDRVSAYAGNTKPLEQRYAMSQDLLDLLALQKIKSQKDSAARDMQLQMAQQQAQNGEGSMTVAQQREKEVSDMTKNELTQQRGDTAQQQTAQQQAMMQKMMGGIAGAPGANAAAQPKMMAAGGIVGYAGPEGSVVGGEQDPEFDEDGNPRPKSERDRIAAANARMRMLKNKPILVGKTQDDRVTTSGSPKEIELTEEFYKPRRPDITRAEQAVTTQGAAPATAPLPAGPQAAVSPVVQPPAAPAAPKPPAPPGIAGLPGAAPAGPAAPAAPVNDFGTKLEAAALKNAEIDPEARGLDTEKRVEGRMALTPEQRKVYEEGIGGLQKMYQEQYDPERQRQEGIKRALIGAGGRRYGEFAGAATAGMNYDEQMRAAKLKEFGDVQKARTGLIDIDRANVKEGIGAGQKAHEQASLSQRQGLESGSRLYDTDVSTRDKALDREIEKLKIAATNAATGAVREGLTQDKARAVYAATIGRAQELERKLDDGFSTQYGMLLMQEQTGKLEPAQKTQLETAKLELRQKKDKLRKELEPVLESARQKLGVPSTDGFGDMKKVDSKK